MMRTFFLNIMGMAIAVAVIGCASAGNNFNESRTTSIQKGVTTEKDLVDMFGAPNSQTRNSDGMTILEWTYAESQVNGKSFIPYAGAFLGGSSSANKSLKVTLNSSGVVTDYTMTSGGMDYRSNQLGTEAGKGN
jgi:hypothetical protein